MPIPTSFSLRDGRKVSLRSIEPADGSALVCFHESLSDRTRRYRFFTFHPHLTDAEVERFTNVDHHDREALVAVSDGQIVGVGRFDRTGPTSGEVAFVVQDEWQGLGLGTLLLERLSQWAQESGTERFEAEVLGDNRQMLEVFSRWCPRRRASFDFGCVHLDMPFG